LSSKLRIVMKLTRTLIARAAGATLVLALAACAGPGANGVPGALNATSIAAIVANPERSAADRKLDAVRQPEKLLAFIGVRPGMQVLDLNAGGGYTSELLARSVGATGRVYGQSAPPPADAKSPAWQTDANGFRAGPEPARTRSFAALLQRGRQAQLGTLEPVVLPFESPVPDAATRKGLDLVTFMFNYHDLAHWGVDRASLNQAVFAGLKPGGTYVIADHAGRAGTGITESDTLHRVEEALVRQEVEAAGFRFVAASEIYRNPADPRDQKSAPDGQRTDGFLLKFVKP